MFTLTSDAEAPRLNRHGRRKAEALYRQDEALSTVKHLTTTAHARLVTQLTHFGNKLSERHSQALMRMMGSFSHLAAGTTKPGRYAFPLDTGCGKSQSVVAWIATIHELGLPFSVAVSAHKVEALCGLKRDLLSAGVPTEKIGLWHTHPFAEAKAEGARKGLVEGFASIPANADGTNHTGFQFLLLTHNRVRGAAGKFGISSSLGLTYRGEERSLMIWDESLLISDHRAVSLIDVASGLGWWEPRIGRDDHGAQAAATFLRECRLMLDDELTQQREEKRDPKLLSLPARDVDALEGYLKALPRNDAAKPLATLIEISQNPVRVVKTAQDGGAFVSYEIAVPSELKRIAVLDASWPIRRLEQLDRSIKQEPGFDGKVKSYNHVTVNYLRHKAGRASTEASFGSERKSDRAISKEVSAVIQGIPEDEAALVFTFKARQGMDIGKTLRADLEAAGIDTEKTVTVPEVDPETGKERPVQRPRIAMLTFGNETSLSEYSYCRHVIFCGVLFRSDYDLAGAIIGQNNDPLHPVTQTKIGDIRRSEAAHVIYQGLSRGACRKIDNDEAHRMSVYLMHPDPRINELLKTAMPGVVIQPWETKHLKATEAKAEGTAGKIVAYLNGLPEGVDEMSIRKLKVDAGLGEVAHMTFVRARDEALKAVPWQLRGRTLIRPFAPN